MSRSKTGPRCCMCSSNYRRVQIISRTRYIIAQWLELAQLFISLFNDSADTFRFVKRRFSKRPRELVLTWRDHRPAAEDYLDLASMATLNIFVITNYSMLFYSLRVSSAFCARFFCTDYYYKAVSKVCTYVCG